MTKGIHKNDGLPVTNTTEKLADNRNKSVLQNSDDRKMEYQIDEATDEYHGKQFIMLRESNSQSRIIRLYDPTKGTAKYFYNPSGNIYYDKDAISEEKFKELQKTHIVRED